MAVVTDTLEGLVSDVVWYHYDLADDVLYLRTQESRTMPTVAEELENGLLLLRLQADDRPVGITAVNWWKGISRNALPDSISQIAEAIEGWTNSRLQWLD